MAPFITLLGVLAVFLYVQYGVSYLDPQLGLLFHKIVIGIIGIVTFFTASCAVHLKSLGMKSKGEIKKEVKNRLSDLSELLAELHGVLSDFQLRYSNNVMGLSRKGADALSMLRKFHHALENRYNDVQQIAKAGGSFDLAAAHYLMMQPLGVRQSALECVIDADPVPALHPSEWRPKIEKLVDEIQSELQKVA